MKQVILQVEEENALSELKESLKEVKQMQMGELPKQTAEAFLDEL